MPGGKEIMSKGYTEIIYILDRSGSMGGLESDTIGGFNSMMEQQKKTGEKAGVSKAVCSVMMADSLCEVEGCLDNSDWDEEINADYQRRGSGRKARR
jgi:hypothetical protein